MTGINLAELASSIEEQSKKLPPLEKWNPDFSGDLDMKITRDGRWFYLGSEIKRQKLVRLFSTILVKEEEDYFLMTPVEKFRIQVEDAPFVAVTADVSEDPSSGHSVLIFETNVGDRVIAGADHPIRVMTDEETAEPSPYVLVRKNLEALISRPVFYQLVEHADMDEGSGKELFVQSRGVRFSLGHC